MTSEKYLTHAKRARRLAQEAADPTTRGILINIAGMWEFLAKRSTPCPVPKYRFYHIGENGCVHAVQSMACDDKTQARVLAHEIFMTRELSAVEVWDGPKIIYTTNNPIPETGYATHAEMARHMATSAHDEKRQKVLLRLATRWESFATGNVVFWSWRTARRQN
jgi:hypothetical protein